MRKQYILYIVIAILSLTNILNINNVSALSYSSNVGIGFTFNPTLSVSLSSSDLVISNLAPGSSADSNSINVSVATNASYGYTLSATVGDSTYNNSNLTHSNNTNIFSSIAIDADLSSLDEDEDTNIWGYSYRNNIASPSTWSNYNGLSSSSNAILLDNDDTADSTGSIDFKIGAKAASTQASGTYTNTINFIAVTKVAPMSLLDSFMASGAEQLNGYFKMQDMTHSICSNVDIEESELQLIDVRDNKIYWVAKLKDGNCWMTQNLDLDITASSTALNSNNTDISTDESIYTATNTIHTLKGESDAYGYTYENGIAAWIPERNTIAYSQLNSTTWTNDGNHPYSYDRLNISTGEPVYPDGNVSQALAGDHGLSGNYYNWTASVASNDSSNTNSANPDPANSICPKGWRLPTISNMANNITNSTNEFSRLNLLYNNNSTDSASSLISYPLYFIRSGFINNGTSSYVNSSSYYLSSTPGGSTNAWVLLFGATGVIPNRNDLKSLGFSLRCIAR